MSYLGYLIKNKDRIKKKEDKSIDLLQDLKKKSILEERKRIAQEKLANRSSQRNDQPKSLFSEKKDTSAAPKSKEKKISDPLVRRQEYIDRIKSKNTNQYPKNRHHDIGTNTAPQPTELSNKKKITKKASKDKRKETREDVHHIITRLVKKYYDQQELLKADVNRIFHDVKEDLDMLPKKRKPRKKKIEYTDDLFNDKEVSKILSKAEELGDTQSLASTLFFKFGLKLYEIAKLKIEDVDVMRKVIKVDGKNVKVDDSTFKKIVDYISGRNSGQLFGKGSGKRFERQDLLEMMKSIMSSAKIKQRKNIESAIDNYRKSLNSQGKAYTYWDHIDKVIEIRNKEVNEYKGS